MIPNSDNSSLVFVERQPDWMQGVDLDAAHQTAIFKSRTGLEQRQRGRATPTYRITYKQTAVPRSEFIPRQTRIAAEITSPLVVPFWTERASLHITMTGDAAEIDVDPREEFFVVGQYAYLFSSAGGQFRMITAVTGRTLTLQALTGSRLYAIGDAIYPCRLCKRVQGEDRLTREHQRNFTEDFIYETIT